MDEHRTAGEGAAVEGTARQYPCPQCGGKLQFSATKQQLECTHCGHLEPVPTSDEDVVEYDFEEALRHGVGRGYGVRRKSFRCESCGAVTSYDDSVTSTRCAFCDSPRVIEEALPDDVIRPESLIPFQIDKQKALEQFRAWISSRWFRPNNLKNAWELGEIKGLYLPFWTYDSQTDSRWTAEAGYYYYTTETYVEEENGRQVTKERQVQHVRWEPAWGRLEAFFDDELVCASKGVSRSLVLGLYPFELSVLSPYSPQYLSGWGAERYQIDLQEGWKAAQESISAQVRSRCAAQVPGDTQRNLQVSTRFSEIRFKHLLLPIWIAGYRYQGKIYQFLVNGQTGAVSGSAPWSWIKIALAVILALILVALGVYLKQR